MSAHEKAKLLLGEWGDLPIHKLLERSNDALSDVVQAGCEVESRMEPHTVAHSNNATVYAFKGPLWAALEYVRAAGEPSSGGYWIVKKVEAQ